MKRLIVTGDDFGLSAAVNEAIERDHEAGFLTQASLLVTGGAMEEAVRIARRHPGLHVGLHLAASELPPAGAQELAGAGGCLPSRPSVAGLKWALRPGLEGALEREIVTQFDRFLAAGLPGVAWDGHHHLHLHPVLLRLTLPVATARGFRVTRVMREPGARGAQAAVFRWLAAGARRRLRRAGIRWCDAVFGLSDTGRISLAAVQRIAARVPDGWSEFYYHPGADGAACAAEASQVLAAAGITPATSADLAEAEPLEARGTAARVGW